MGISSFGTQVCFAWLKDVELLIRWQIVHLFGLFLLKTIVIWTFFRASHLGIRSFLFFFSNGYTTLFSIS